MVYGNKAPAHVHEGEGFRGRLYSIYHHIVYWAGPNPHWRVLTRLFALVVWLGVLWVILGDAVLPKGFRSKDCITCVRLRVNESNDTIYPCNETDVSILGMFQYDTDDITVGYSYVNCCVNQINFFIEGSMTESQIVDVLHYARPLPVEHHESIITKEGQVFALVVVLMASALGGFIARALRLPSLFGMLVVGIMLRNVDAIAVADDIHPGVAYFLKNVALVLVTTRGGVYLDADVVRQQKFQIIKLALMPSLCEAIADGIAGHFLLDLPWLWSFMLGFIISAISPSILIPGLLNLQEHGFGTNKGIPSLLIASASIDDVISISIFEILLGIEFAIGNIVFSIFRGPIEIIMGLVYGISFGLICWQIPHRHDMKKGTRNRNRLAIMIGLAMLGYFGARRVKVYETGFISAGSLAAFVVAFVASIGWKRTGKTLVGRSLGIVWRFFQPLLLGLIGTDADFSVISIDLLARGIGVLSIGVIVRVIAVLVALHGSKLNYKEKLFVVITMLPRATVQTVVGSVAVDQAMRSGDPREQGFGKTLVAIAVLDILIFAPIGALSIGLFGPHLLTQEGHHHAHIEHNIEGEVDITGKIESESESSEDEDDDEYETDDEPSFESLSRHMRDVQQLTSHATADFHCCIDCDHLQDRLKFDCFRQMVEHDYVHNRRIHLGSVHHHCSGYSSESQSFKSVHSSVHSSAAFHHRSTHSLDSESYMSIPEEEEEETVTSPASDTTDISVAQLIGHKPQSHHGHHDHHHVHHHGHHHHHHSHHHGHHHHHHHHGHHHHGKHSDPYHCHANQLQVKVELHHRRSCSPTYNTVPHQETCL